MMKQVCTVGAVVAGASLASAQVPYFNNFSSTPGAEWSNTTTSLTPSNEPYLGQFGNGTVTLNLGTVPAGSYTLSFDFYAIQSLDGNGPAGGGPDNFQFLANGSNLLFTNFDNFGSSGQAYPSQLPPFGPGASNAPGTGASAINTLGFTFGGAQIADAIYSFSFSYTHAGGTLSFDFVSFQNQGNGDEGWGLDNVRVVPAPGAAGLALVGLGALSRRRNR